MIQGSNFECIDFLFGALHLDHGTLDQFHVQAQEPYPLSTLTLGHWTSDNYVCS